MLQEATPCSARYEKKTMVLVALLMGASFGALLSFPGARYTEESATSMVAKSLRQSLQSARMPVSSPLNGNRYGMLSHLPQRTNAITAKPFSVRSTLAEEAKTWKLPKMADKPVYPRQYELFVIMRPDADEGQIDRMMSNIETKIKDAGAEDIEITQKGRHQMAYPIKGFYDGHYILMHYTGLGEAANKLQEFFNNPDIETQERILRWANFRMDKKAR